MSLDQIPVEQLRPEFRQGVASLLQVIFAKVQAVKEALSTHYSHAQDHSSGYGSLCTHSVWAARLNLADLLQHICKARQHAVLMRHAVLPPLQAQPRSYGTLGIMSGPLLAGLTCAYVDAINAGAVPTIATAWQVRYPALQKLVQQLLQSSQVKQTPCLPGTAHYTARGLQLWMRPRNWMH